MSVLRSPEGISEGEMYRERTSYARSWNERLAQAVDQSEGSDGIVSGMNRPLSLARPLSTAASKENW